ncbi:MAG: SDR family oxidoreductase [Chloroflexi bacterium]|nr:SDR family oxidoreductase [Chloroflexota bacterium]
MNSSTSHNKQRVFITGANRGIGFEITRQCLARGAHVFASCRQPDRAVELKELKTEYADMLSILQLDVTNQAQIDAVVEAVQEEVSGLDILFNNAGISPPEENSRLLESSNVLSVLHVNSVAPIIVAQSFLGLLKAGEEPKIINISSQLGSITRKSGGNGYSYSASKAALNMFSRIMAFDILPEGVITIVIHPGWVKTDMGGKSAHLTVSKSVRGILQVTDKLKKQDAGRFLAWDGVEVPW